MLLFAPIGICSLITHKLCTGDFVKNLEQLGFFALTVITGLIIHICIVMPLIYFFSIRENAFKFMWRLSPALSVAFGTASSIATLPVTMKCCEEANNISLLTSRFVLPLGTTLNMNGTALYEAVAALFIAQAYGVDLSIGGTIIVAITATLAAVGAAGIPEAGLVTLILVLESVNLPLEGIGLLLSIDWFLDRCRTMVNVAADALVCGIVDYHWKRQGGDDLIKTEIEQGANNIERTTSFSEQKLRPPEIDKIEN